MVYDDEELPPRCLVGERERESEREREREKDRERMEKEKEGEAMEREGCAHVCECTYVLREWVNGWLDKWHGGR